MAAHRRGGARGPGHLLRPALRGAGAGSPDTRTWAWMALCVGGVRWAIEALWVSTPPPLPRMRPGPAWALSNHQGGSWIPVVLRGEQFQLRPQGQLGPEEKEVQVHSASPEPGLGKPSRFGAWRAGGCA